MSLLLRCPEDVQQLRAIWNRRFLRKASPELEAKYLAIRFDRDPPTFVVYMAGTPQDVSERMFFRMLLGLINHESVGEFIMNMDWRVLELPPSGFEFLTSDRPVIRTNGIKNAGGHIAIPIGPRALFLATHERQGARDIISMDPREVVKQTNRQVVEGAAKFVYATDTRQMRFVQNHFAIARQPRLADSMQRADDAV